MHLFYEIDITAMGSRLLHGESVRRDDISPRLFIDDFRALVDLFHKTVE